MKRLPSRSIRLSKKKSNVLKFPRSTYYKALVCVPSNRQKEHETFGQEVKRAYEDSKQRYGAVKICRILNDSRTSGSVKRVQRHMAEQGLRSIVVKKYKHHASHGTIPNGKVNILKRGFEANTIHQKWCTDITYIHVQKEEWTYLASVMDLCSLKSIGYDYGTSMTADLAVEAVENACLNVRDTKGIILHSDLIFPCLGEFHMTCLTFQTFDFPIGFTDFKNAHRHFFP